MSKNLLILSGTEHFLRRRQLNVALRTAYADGWGVEFIEGSDREALSCAISGSVFCAASSTLVVVSQPEKADPSLIEGHAKDTGSSVMLLLHHVGKPRTGSAFANLIKKYKGRHKTFEAPPLYKQQEVAVEFCFKEAKERGIHFDTKLANALVTMAGSDLGVLYYEVFKICTLAEEEGVNQISATTLKDGMAELSEASAFQLLDALEQKNLKKVCSTLDRIKKTHSGDPTIRLCGFLWKFVLQWLVVADLIRQGVSDKETADKMGTGVWFYRNRLFPAAKNWGLSKLKEMVRGLASAERAVKSGAISPWNVFASNLLSLFQ